MNTNATATATAAKRRPQKSGWVENVGGWWVVVEKSRRWTGGRKT